MAIEANQPFLCYTGWQSRLINHALVTTVLKNLKIYAAKALHDYDQPSPQLFMLFYIKIILFKYELYHDCWIWFSWLCMTLSTKEMLIHRNLLHYQYHCRQNIYSTAKTDLTRWSASTIVKTSSSFSIYTQFPYEDLQK